MKTTFSRQFALTASLILISMLLMALSFQPMLRSYLVDMTQQNLTSNAEAVAKLAAAYDTSGELENVSDKWSLKTVWGVGYKFESET